jgi:predicted outer membrane repeat protein
MRTQSFAVAPGVRPLGSRLLLLAVSTLGGALAWAALLGLLGGPVHTALAAPSAPATTRTWPGSGVCAGSLQACINGSNALDTIEIQPNTYITSITLSKAVSLTGVSSATVILQALTGQRVLTVTGAAISNSVVISGITFRGGKPAGGICPAGCGGAILITGTASPLLHGLLITNNVAGFEGGGIFANAGSPLRLEAVSVLSNTSVLHGGGTFAGGPATLDGGLFRNNRCTLSGCGAGALYATGPSSVNGTQFISNTSLGGAGAVYVPFAATFTGGLFQDNRCTEDSCFGGALYANSSLAMTGTQFLSNTSRYFGGAVYANQPAGLRGVLFRNNRCTQTGCSGGGVQAFNTLALTNTQFISNSSLAGGGAALAQSRMSALDSLVQDNRCTQANCKGGGLYASFALTLTNSQVLSNTATASGGGAYTDGPAVVAGGSVQNNRCTQDGCQGGGLYAGSGLNLNSTGVISNSSLGNGAGVYALGPLTLAGGLFQLNRCTQAACGAGGLYAGGLLSLNGTQFIGNISLGGAGALYAPLDATIDGGLFQDNHCTEDTCFGGALYANSSLVMVGTQFLGNTSRYFGGALFANQPATITTAIFDNNQCTQSGCSGGGIYALGGLNMADSQVTSNTATSGGGLAAGGKLVLANTQVMSNSAATSGGGAYGGLTTLQGGLFQNNRCTQSGCNGGGLYASGPLGLTNTHFINNTSLFDGGGVYAASAVTLTGGLLQGNQCTGTFCFAGGLMAASTATLAGTRFIDNSSKSHGGGVYAMGVLDISGAEFIGNHSAIGGGLNHSGASGQIVNTLFAGNQASTNDGAALSMLSAGSTELVHNTIASATPGSGSAVYVQDHTARLTNTLVSGYAIGLELASGGSLTEDYTLFSGVTLPTSGAVSAGAHSFSGVAGFVDPAAGDFHIGGGSDAINAGAATSVAVDFDGQPRPSGAASDIGFDEFQAIPYLLYLPLVRR